MTRSHLLSGKSDSFYGLSKATPTELPERRYEKDARGGNSGDKQLRDNRGNTCRGVIRSKDILLARSARKHRENRLQ